MTILKVKLNKQTDTPADAVLATGASGNWPIKKAAVDSITTIHIYDDKTQQIHVAPVLHVNHVLTEKVGAVPLTRYSVTFDKNKVTTVPLESKDFKFNGYGVAYQ